MAGVAVVAVIAGSFVIPKLTGGQSSAPAAAPGGHSMAGMARGTGEGPAVGSSPQFDERNVITGQPISSASLQGQKTLLFFSEGVMCQACLHQIKDIDDVGAQMSKRHIKLVSVTPDSPQVLAQAIGQYGITSPVISDEDRNMSSAFNTLGKGMHPDMPGHAFVLLDGNGNVLWQRDYYLPPSRTMYVTPQQLLADIPAA